MTNAPAIYLDYNATTPVAPEVREAMLPFLSEEFGNPSSAHRLGRTAKQAVEIARQSVAGLLGAELSEIIFTSGGTEANNLAIVGLVHAKARGRQGHLIISALEHPATIEPARYLESLGFRVSTVLPTSAGVVTPESIEALLCDDTLLVSIMHANNEIGTVQPIDRIASICRRHNITLHTDAAQSIGKLPASVAELGVDLLSIAGHKFYAPKGIGALYVRKGTAIHPVLRGAGQEQHLRPGTENVASIVGLGRAASLVAGDLAASARRLAALRDRLTRRLREAIGDELIVHGEAAQRLPNTLSVSFPGVLGSELLSRAPHVCASTGAACHSGTTRISATLAAIGVTEDIARGTVRLSLGRYTRQDDVDCAAHALIEAWKRQVA